MPKDATTGAAGTSTTLLPSPVNESWPTAGWRTSAPEAVGMSSRALASLVDFGGANDVDSVLVTRHGQIVAEAYYPPFVPGLKHALNSATKTVVGALVGIAVQRGLLATLDQPVLEALGAHDAANSDAHKRAVTLQHLLDMDSGLAWQEPLAGRPETVFEMTQSPDWTRFVLDRPMAQAPGSGFNYSSGNSHLLSALLSRHTQQSALAFAQQHLFAPLGIDDVTWPSDPQGVSMGGYGLFMQPRDMAKLGYLFLRRGRWQDQQLLSPAWFDRVEHASVPMPSIANSTLRMFYANGFWCAPEYHAYMAMGMLRQVILVMPRLDVVAVFTGRKHYPMSDVFKLLEQAVDDGAAPPNQDATECARAGTARGSRKDLRHDLRVSAQSIRHAHAAPDAGGSGAAARLDRGARAPEHRAQHVIWRPNRPSGLFPPRRCACHRRP